MKSTNQTNHKLGRYKSTSRPSRKLQKKIIKLNPNKIQLINQDIKQASLEVAADTQTKTSNLWLWGLIALCCFIISFNSANKLTSKTIQAKPKK